MAMEFATTKSLIVCSKIIFNLALVHHTSDRASMKAYSLYQIAITLLSAVPLPTDADSLLLHIAVLNNYAVWCFDNHEYASMNLCCEEITYILDETPSSIHDAVKRGMGKNLNALMIDIIIDVPR